MCALKWNDLIFFHHSVVGGWAKILFWENSHVTTFSAHDLGTKWSFKHAEAYWSSSKVFKKRSERSIIDANNKSWPATLKPCSMPSPSSPTQRWGCRIFANSWQKMFCEEQWQAKVRRISIHFCISSAALSIMGPSQLRPALLCPCIGTYKKPRFVVI